MGEPLPVSPGHTLIVPRRLVATWFDATREEQLALLDLVDEVKRRLDEEHPSRDLRHSSYIIDN